MRLEEVVRDRTINWYFELIVLNHCYVVISASMILHGTNFHTHVNAN